MEERIRHDLELEIEELEQLLSDRLYDYEQMKAEHLREYPDQHSELAWEASQHHNDYYRCLIAPLRDELERKRKELALFS